MATLDDVAEAADDVADDQREVARRARSMQREHDRGRPWGQILDGEGGPTIIDLMRRSVRRLSTARRQLTSAIAHGLNDEGESHRKIAARFGVTRQRVSSLLRGPSAD